MLPHRLFDLPRNTYDYIFSLMCLTLVLLILSHANAHAIELCGWGKRVTCVVDGDTIWWKGEKIRLEGIDAPEKSQPRCPQEALQAAEATDRLREILTEHTFTIERYDKDRYGRTLARLRIGNTTAGDMLVSEGLAKIWEGRKAQWCE